jgi:hypothetical protein
MIRVLAAAMVILAFGADAPVRAQDKVSPEEAKAATELLKRAKRADLDHTHPDKPVIRLMLDNATIDEATVALINKMKHLKTVGGVNVTFEPGTLKALKGHPALERLELGAYSDLAVVLELPEGPALKELSLGDGDYTVEHFEAIAKLPSLRSVSIRPLFTRIKPELYRPLQKMKNLESLDAASIMAVPFSPMDIAGFGSLKQFACIVPQDADDFFDALVKLKSLRKLDVTPHFRGKPTKVPPQGLNKVAQMTDLTELSIRGPITDETLAALAPLTNLTALGIESGGLTAAGIKSLGKLPKLTVLHLVGRPLPNAALAELTGLSGLKCLRLYIGPISEEGMKTIGSLTQLEELVIGRFQPGVEKALPAITKLTKLRKLDLATSDLTDDGLNQLAVLKDLTELRIGWTKTTPAGHTAFQKALPNVKLFTDDRDTLKE